METVDFNFTLEQVEEILHRSDAHEWYDAMIITNSAIKLMHNWISNKTVKKYSMSPDHDNKWRTGGSVDNIITESKLDPRSLLNGIKVFAVDKESRLSKI